MPTYGGMRLVLEIKTDIVCNRVLYPTELPICAGLHSTKGEKNSKKRGEHVRVGPESRLSDKVV